ncbi:MAG: DUF481 domain-containing protein [Gemmatimonadota bacterium]|nr:DUF481 domain-containing protein [Gemmatimonadota bacterium]
MFVLTLITAAVIGAPARAPRAPITCTLANGDRLSGELVSTSPSRVTIRHASLGRLAIQRSSIASCETSDTTAIRRLGALALSPFAVEPSATVAQVPEFVILPVISADPGEVMDRLIHPAHAAVLALRALPTTVSNVGWKRALGTTYMLTRGNANVSSMGFTGAIARRTDRSQLALKAKREFGSREGTSTENYLSTTLRYDLALGTNDSSAASRPSFLSEAVYEHDPFAKVGRRAVENTGFSVPLSRNAQDKLALEIGVGLTNQQPTGGASSTLLGGLLRLAAHQLFGGAQADQAIAIFPDLTGSAGHYRLTGDFNIAAPIARAIALKIGLANRYDTQPQENVRKSDTTIQSGLAVEF